jgi:hypothetical protein
MHTDTQRHEALTAVHRQLNMKLADAIRIANAPPEDGGEPKSLRLICGFAPLHVSIFLKAYGRVRFPAAGTKLDTLLVCRSSWHYRAR